MFRISSRGESWIISDDGYEIGMVDPLGVLFVENDVRLYFEAEHAVAPHGYIVYMRRPRKGDHKGEGVDLSQAEEERTAEKIRLALQFRGHNDPIMAMSTDPSIWDQPYRGSDGPGDGRPPIR